MNGATIILYNHGQLLFVRKIYGKLSLLSFLQHGNKVIPGYHNYKNVPAIKSRLAACEYELCKGRMVFICDGPLIKAFYS